MKYLICFDISDDRKRYRTVKVLSEYSYRVQKSVFEGFLSKDTLLEMMDKIKNCIDEKTDSVRVYPLCARCEQEVRITGTGTKVEDVEYIIL